MPNAVYEPSACIKASLAAAKRANFDPSRLMFEFTENEQVTDPAHVENIVASYKRMGFTTALDDFGAGYAGLGLLARFQPDLIKIDMELVRSADTSMPRRAIVAGIVQIAHALGIQVLAEGHRNRSRGRRHALRRHPADAGIPFRQARTGNVQKLRRTERPCRRGVRFSIAHP